VNVRPFRFGVQLWAAGSRREWAEKARRAEALGYDVLAVPDHMGTQLAPFAALVAAAAATTSIRLGTFVLDNDFRHPVVMAHEAATVHLLSDGRLELGIGAGWRGRDYDALGIEFAAPAVRYARLAETVEIVQRYFGGETFSFEGAHYTIGSVEPLRLPEGMPPPRLVIGAGGPRMLALAGRRADCASVFLTSARDGSGFRVEELEPEAFAGKIDRLRAAAGARADDVEINVLLQSFELTQDRRGAAERLAADLETTTEDYLALPFGLVGTIDEVVEDLLVRRERWGISYVTVFAEHLEGFAPVVERLSGV
jgi:probable F420-dependent oxidoreductase